MANTGVSVTIDAIDKTSAKFDAVNKRIAGLSKATYAASKSLATIGDGSSGVAKLSEGMLSLGNNSLGAFRALEQMISPMATITSAASLAGMAALEKQWASTGTTISKTAYALNMPVSKLSGLEKGLQLAGSSAGAAETTIKGMNATLQAAFYRHDQGALSTLAALNIDASDGHGNIAKTEVALDQLANKIKTYKDHGTQVRAITSIGGDADALTALKDGAEGLDEWVKKANETGAVWTNQMAENATKVQGSFSRLQEDLEGIGNHIADDWSGITDRAMTATSKWIEHNQELAKSYSELVGGVLAFGALKPAAWLMRLLGLGAAVELAPMASTLALSGDTVSGDQAKDPWTAVQDAAGPLGGQPGIGGPRPGPGFFGRNGTVDRFFGTENNPTAPKSRPGPISDSTEYWRTHPKFGNLNLSPMEQLLAKGEAGAGGYSAVNRGEAGNYSAGMENLANMTVAQVMAAQKAHRFNAAGRYQIIGSTLKDAARDLHLTGDEKFDKTTQDRIFKDYLISVKRPEIAAYISGASDDIHAAQVGMAKEWGSVAHPDTGKSYYGADGHNRASISPDQAASALNDARAGAVHVTVELKGAHPGTQAKAVASGIATTSPPRVETAMAGF